MRCQEVFNRLLMELREGTKVRLRLQFPFPMSQTKWSSYLIELYASRKPPVTGTVDVDKLEAKAREALKDHQGNHSLYLRTFDLTTPIDAFLYVYGSAGTMSTYRANQAAFDAFKIVPRMMVDATDRHLSVRRRFLPFNAKI